MKISTILEQIDLGNMALPEFQRGYVWNRDQVRGLMYSLYRKYPVGSLLVWVTKTEQADARGSGELSPGTVELILDGQQRITSLYGIIKGREPKFFEGNSRSFTGIYFNIEDEVFEFYAPLKMKDDPLWIDVTGLMKTGVADAIKRLMAVPELKDNIDIYINRINAAYSINDVALHIEKVVGEDKTVDVVVDIFNRVNSGGTKLSKGDLALARICATWPEARDEMNKRLVKWRDIGFHFKLEWFLRNINTILTGEALFSALKDTAPGTFQDGLNRAEKHIDYLLNLIASRLGLDHDRVLGSRYSFPLMARYLDDRGGKLADFKETNKLLYWYVHSFLWGRYAGSTESVLNQDLEIIENGGNHLDGLIGQLRQNRGDLRLQSEDFLGWSKGARFYPLLYMLTRVCGAKDWESGTDLTSHLLGKLSGLQVHHIFPKALLYKHGYKRPDVNAIANFTFLTQETNLSVSDQDPAKYLSKYEKKHPGVLESHWIPNHRKLWKVENYKDFLAARRELLAKAANDFLDSLMAAKKGEEKAVPVSIGALAEIPGGAGSEEEEQLLVETNAWVVETGLPEGELMFELTDEESGEPLAILDLAWPDGLQEGYSQPVALLIDEDEAIEEAANRAGYRFFTNVDEFRNYVREQILAEAV